MLYYQWFITIIFLFPYTECAKILGIFHVPSPSHYHSGSNLMKILAENGHEVTVVSPFGEGNPPKNYKDVVLTGVYEKMQKGAVNLFEVDWNIILMPFFFNKITSGMVEECFNHTNFQKLIKSGEKFDLVIMQHFNSDAMKYMAQYFNAPLIVYTPLEANEWINPYQGNPDNPAYLPLLNLQYTSNMSFLQRVLNTVMYVYGHLIRVFWELPTQNRILHKYFPEAPHLNEFISNISLTLVNTDPSTHEAQPRVPSIISIGGFHIRKPKPLPEDIKTMLDNAKNGVIYFSMGSNIKSKDMPKEKKDMFLRVFAKLDVTVLWKFEDDALLDKPDNVFIRKWLPQNDIFAHKNVKLFITHGGIFSTMETVHHGIPILAIPIFGDQKANAKIATAAGYAKWLDFKSMTEQELEKTIKELLTNPKYIKNAKARSKIMLDKPRSSQETVNFWVDYVIRHKGADHLRVAAVKLSWYQYLLLDVVAFLIIALIVCIVIIRCIIQIIMNILCKNNQSKIKVN